MPVVMVGSPSSSAKRRAASAAPSVHTSELTTSTGRWALSRAAATAAMSPSSACNTAAVWERWPEHPPYEGIHDDVVPHLTVSETPIAVDVALPIASRAHEVLLIEKSRTRCEMIAAELGNVVQRGNADEASVLADAGKPANRRPSIRGISKTLKPSANLSGRASELETAVHAHPAGAVTATVLLPPANAKFWVIGFIENVHTLKLPFHNRAM